jgi:hypothetical protein
MSQATVLLQMLADEGCDIKVINGELRVHGLSRIDSNFGDKKEKRITSEIRRLKTEIVDIIQAKDSDLDPRPDLEEDSKLWQSLLRHTWENDLPPRKMHGLLHGLRCAGVRLKVGKNKYGASTYQIDWDQCGDMAGWSEDDLIEKWLKPMTSEIKDVFRRVA